MITTSKDNEAHKEKTSGTKDMLQKNERVDDTLEGWLGEF
jgi:hypothetical protein